jgi:protein arginine N-methyltransferase 1
MSIQLDEHRQLLADRTRIDALSRAIAALVTPGDIVLDVASGTAILGLLACRAGASRVYCIEQSGIIGVARELARANGFGDRMHFVMAHSSWAEIPESVDAIVCDQIGHFGFEAGIVEMIADVRSRFLKPGGRIMPAAIALHVAPIELPSLREELNFWTTPLEGLDLSPARKIAVNSGHPLSLPPSALLGPAAKGCLMDLATVSDAPMSFTSRLIAARDGTLDGIGGWFVADLGGGVTMTNAPGAQNRIDRRNVAFPIDPAVDVRAGDDITVTMSIRPSDLLVHWVVSVRNGEYRSSHSTLLGMLLTPETLRCTNPHFVPNLTARGEARKTVLELCDGVHTLDCIEREVFGRHPTLFRDYSEAQVFVAEVVTRYAN